MYDTCIIWYEVTIIAPISEAEPCYMYTAVISQWNYALCNSWIWLHDQWTFFTYFLSYFSKHFTPLWSCWKTTIQIIISKVNVIISRSVQELKKDKQNLWPFVKMMLCASTSSLKFHLLSISALKIWVIKISFQFDSKGDNIFSHISAH